MTRTPTTKSSTDRRVKLSRKAVHSSVGAPSQHNQGSRKGKRSWRKNVDIEDVEQGLEELRAEERVTGTFLQKQKDGELFQIDVKGDDQIRKSLPRFSSSQLTSTKILRQRSAVPAVLSRATAGSKRKKGIFLSTEEKSRLLRIARRPRRGPFNSIIDPAGSAPMLDLSSAVKNSGGYDPWGEKQGQDEQEEVKYGLEAIMKKKIKAPVLPHPRDVIEVPAVNHPHQGTSYNPPADAHRELLLKANEIEERRLKEEHRLKEVKAKVDLARREVGDAVEGVASGMTVDDGRMDDEDAGEQDETDREDEDGTKAPKKGVDRKTKRQRKKATSLLAEKRSLAERAAKKRLSATINDAKALRRAAKQTLSMREKAHADRLLASREKLKKGLAGQKLGKYKVPQGEVDVQLGEDLSENLRALKPEGNLFRDRFLSLQQRALIEPRVPVLPTKRKNRSIAYEKHPWKRFE